MPLSTPAGSSFYICKTFQAAQAITILSNNNPALATVAGHGLTDNKEVLYEGGWELVNNSVFRVDAQDANTFQFKRMNTANVNSFLPGTGLGTVKLINTADWIPLPNVLGISPSGGTPRYADERLLASLQGIKLFDGFEASSMGFEIGHDVSAANWDTLMDISQTQVPVAYKSLKGNGAATYGYGFFAMSETPQQAQGRADRVQATFVAIGRTVSYGVN